MCAMKQVRPVFVDEAGEIVVLTAQRVASLDELNSVYDAPQSRDLAR